MCQCVPSIRCLNIQVFFGVPLSSVMTLISVACSFVGENVSRKWLLTAMDVIKVRKGLGCHVFQNYQYFSSVCGDRNELNQSCFFCSMARAAQAASHFSECLACLYSNNLCALRSCTIVSCASLSYIFSHAMFPSWPCAADISKVFVASCCLNSLFS
jgi:hypothetical protein